MKTVAGIGGGGAEGPVPQLPPIIINCNKPNGDCSPSIPQPAAPDREPGGKTVKFGNLPSADLKTYPVAKMIAEAARMAGQSLTSKHVDLVLRQYRQQPSMELVIPDQETGKTSSSNLEDGGVLEFVSR